MSQLIQLDIFEDENEFRFNAMKQEIHAIRVSSDKVRKGTYANINEIRKLCRDIDQRLAIIEKHICKS
jgi:hypothetical protein